MKAIQVNGDISAPQITLNRSVPRPTLEPNTILVRVHAAGITGDEVKWPELYGAAMGIPGHELSGTIESLGASYTGSLKATQQVYGFLAAEKGEAQADYVLCTEGDLASKPETLSHVQAAALPIPILTAWEAIVDRAKLGEGKRVLVTGASGAVGLMLVQLAKLLVGAEVIALASGGHHAALLELGAKQAVDYKTPGWEKTIGKVDAVFDTVGSGVLDKAWDVIAETGHIVTIADPAPFWAFGKGEAKEAAALPSVKYEHFILSPNAERLGKAAEMIDRGELKSIAVKGVPIDEGLRAWEEARQRSRGHKVVIDFVGEA